MTEEEAKRIAIKSTDYCYVIAVAWEGKQNDSVCLERIFVKGGCEEIRLAWWTNGNQAMRPADIEAADWVPLFTKALAAEVFTAEEKLSMVKALLA
jgi:hypothetical protein